MTNRLELNWKIDGFVDEQRYYCSEAQIDPENLPVPKAVLAGDVRFCVDTDIDVGKTYYVAVGSVKNGVEKLSDMMQVSTILHTIQLKVSDGVFVNKGSTPISINWSTQPNYVDETVVVTPPNYLDIADSDAFNFASSDFEVTFVINKSSTQQYAIVMCSKLYPADQYSWFGFINNLLTLRVDGTVPLLQSSVAIENGVDVTVSIRRVGTTLSMLINNVVAASITILASAQIDFNRNNGGTRFFTSTWDVANNTFGGKVREIIIDK